jgi:hypothetical protein
MTGLSNTNYDHLSQSNTSNWYAHSMFNVALPGLESLELGLGCYTNLEKEVKVFLNAVVECGNLQSFTIYL